MMCAKKSVVLLAVLFVGCVVLTFTLHLSPSTNFDVVTSSTPTSGAMQVETTQAPRRTPNSPPTEAGFLPDGVINSVRRFVFFVGYARSGHSILGSLMDAHPNVIIAHEYSLFERLIADPVRHSNRRWLYTRLYNNSIRSYRRGHRKDKANKKGYSLHIGSSWQGHYNQTIEIIGDKAGGMTTRAYSKNLMNGRFVEAFNNLRTTVQIPIVTIHAVRNPFDNIATMLLYNTGNLALKLNTSYDQPYDNPYLLKKQIRGYFSLVESVTNMIKELALNVTEIHNDDLIRNPNATISKLCTALQIECTKEYLAVCSSKIFASPSKTRHLVKWPPGFKEIVEQRIQEFEFLRHYSFDD